MVLALSLCLGPLPSSAQTCTPPVFCEGWARDSSHREVSLTRATICSNIPACPAECSTSATSALPSIRIGSLEHIVLAFSVPDACIPECSGAPPEPCYNLGISFRHKVDVSSEAVTGTYDCDLSDPGTVVSAGATFNATYLTGGTDNIVVSNVLYGSGTGNPQDCGANPTSLDLSANGPSLGIQSHFTLTWNITNDQVAGYTETRVYTAIPPPNTVHITVTNIDYGAGTFTTSAPDADTEIRRSSWGAVKIRYR